MALDAIGLSYITAKSENNYTRNKRSQENYRNILRGSGVRRVANHGDISDEVGVTRRGKLVKQWKPFSADWITAV